jgi:hypothetical protein
MQFSPLQSCCVLVKVKHFAMELSFCDISFYFVCLLLVLLYVVIATSLFGNYSDHMLGCYSVVHLVSVNIAGADVNTVES